MESPLRFGLWLCLCVSLSMVSLCAADLSHKSIKLQNNCSFPVWPGISSWNTHEYDIPAGFRPLLKSGESYSIVFAMSWQGSIWGRYGCSFNRSELGFCRSGDCGGNLRCEKASAQQKISTPITQAVFMNGSCSVDLQSGYNLPISVSPVLKQCGSQACGAYVGAICPKNLQMMWKNEVIGCKGECNAYMRTCSPPAFESAFKKTCPNVFPFQEQVWCFSSTNYTLTFCPPQ
ncbi:hypothetical protein SUGI_0775720 [Cryptomeria japonica]|uniref:thaumatin-like protein n=1 Tax=Cryptomeria japonica TaxID=3369 RepID=UPI002414CB4B|nr:thaumatin-like protein [Cryptomeria japonica]GLJ38104.1 hypothetical protein SUGI_0775720 [Cryptomeria japonica]